MLYFGVLKAIVALSALSCIYGKPTINKNEFEILTRDMPTIEQIEQMRIQKPCQARLLEVRIELAIYPDMITDPHYIPECKDNGAKWKAAQCSHHDDGACFCVHEDNGEILEHTKSKILHKEALSCERAVKGEHTGHECLHMQDEFNHMQESYGLEGHSPLFYYPECTAKGTFMAMQRNDMSFFCVDTTTGDIIPGTDTKPGTIPPLTEHICSAYATVWSNFKDWKKSKNIEKDQEVNEEVVTEESCRPGFTFTECGCPVKCTSTSSTNVKKNNNCVCKPACLCPSGMLDLDGKCVSLEECNVAKPPSEVLQAEKLDELTNGLWSEYKNKNPNAIIHSYNSAMMGEEMPMEGPHPVAFDSNPNINQFFAPQLPPEEGPIEGNQVGAEEIEGGDNPYLRQLLNEIGNPDQESEEYLLSQLYGQEEEFPTQEQEKEMTQEEEVTKYITQEEEVTKYITQEEEVTKYISQEEEPTEYIPEEGYYEMETEAYEYETTAATEYEEPTEYPIQEEEEEEEEEEPDNEFDQRSEEEMNEDEEIDHQSEGEIEFSSVEVLTQEELENHESTLEEPPCGEDCEESTESTTENEEENNALSEINRVLEENGFSSSLEAKLEKPTQSIKKSSSG